MRYGINSSNLPYDADDILDFAFARAHGFDCVDYDLSGTKWPEYQMSEEALRPHLAKIKAKADKAGVEIHQLHGPWPTEDKTEEGRAQKLVFMKRGVLCASLLGAKFFVLHTVMPFGWGEDTDPAFARALTKELLLQLAEYAKPLGVTVCLENMPMRNLKLSPIGAVADLVDEIDLPNVKICLDTGHAFMHGDDTKEMFEKCKKNLACLHIHDNGGWADAHAYPFTVGAINWAVFPQVIRDCGYEGVLTLETIIAPGTPREIRKPLLEASYQILCRLDPDKQL